MARDQTEIIYLIVCTPIQATYVGRAASLTRLHQHRTQLMRGDHPTCRLQWDWDTHGADRFEFLYRPTPLAQQDIWERALTLLFGTLEHQGGYNKKLGSSDWGPVASIRDTERKLGRKGKFCPLPNMHSDQPMHPDYMNSFCRDSMPLVQVRGLEETAHHAQTLNEIRRALRPWVLSQFTKLEVPPVRDTKVVSPSIHPSSLQGV
ncbi:MAG: hypothetical protein WBX11_16990 [Thiobacillaceae bacterium]